MVTIMVQRTPAEVFPVGEFIKEELEARGWTQTDLAEILGRPQRLVSEIINGKRGITPDTARGLGQAFGTDPQLWLNLSSAHQLSLLRDTGDEVQRRAALFSKVPVKEMVRRHWIEHSDNIDVLEQRVKSFLGVENLDDLRFDAAAHAAIAPNAAQCVWLARARQLARMTDTSARYTKSTMESLCKKLRPLLRSTPEVRQIPLLLSEAGIRFVVVEPLPHSRIDGACLWLDEGSPVVVVSMRRDSADSFWFVMMHELGHVFHGDGKSGSVPVDENLVGEGAQPTKDKSDVEKSADAFASEFLIAEKEIRSFISRTRPMYSKAKIIGFANRLGIHPGIVVGRLQWIDEIPYTHSREMFDKVRGIVTPVAITDGWGSLVTTTK